MRPASACAGAPRSCSARWGRRDALRGTPSTRALAVAGAAAALVAVHAAPAPAATRPATVDFLAKGDWGYGGADQARVTRRMCALLARRPVAFVVTTGDNFYPTGRATRETFWGPEGCLLRARVPWRAAWGNHDLGDRSTATVLGARRWYTFARGPLRVIVLDANVPADAAQRAFLRRALLRNRRPYTVVALHQPVYTAGIHAPGADQQRYWAPLFVSHGVDLVLQGHNHAYERIVRDGVTYITTGGGGAPVYPCVRPATGLRTCLPEHHFLDVRVSARRAVVRAVSARGPVLESVAVPARN